MVLDASVDVANADAGRSTSAQSHGPPRVINDGPVDPPVIPASDPTDKSERCTPNMSLAAQRQRLDMYIVMDANITLPYTGLWELATGGLREFVADRRSQGLGVGLRFFGNQCDADVYSAQPTVEVDLLPANSANMVAASNMHLTYTASPMAPALEGGIEHQRRRAADHPDWKQVVVLVSDGFTEDFTCSYTTRDLEDAASSGFNDPPAIETHVIGFGLPTTNPIAEDILDRFIPLDDIAAAGGTHKSKSVAAGSDPSVMNEAFQDVRRAALPCAYDLPSDLDRDNLNLNFSPSNVDLPRVDDATSCGQMPGFYYDPSDMPTSMVLCPASCKVVQADDSQTAILLSGCPTLRR
jgi:hypothetical protein